MDQPEKTKKEDPPTKRILIVDDDEQISTLLRIALQGEGFVTKVARDGRRILPTALEFRPDLVVMDLMMPGRGGYESLRILQSDEATKKIPVIIMTGCVMDNTTQAMMRQEPNLAAYLEKPIAPSRLVNQVHKILNTTSSLEQLNEEQRKNRPQKLITGFDDVL